MLKDLQSIIMNRNIANIRLKCGFINLIPWNNRIINALYDNYLIYCDNITY